MSDYSLEDLLNIVGESGSDQEPTPTYSSELDRFYGEFKIAEGENRIKNYIIFYTYKEVFGGELSKIEFFRQFNKRFKSQKFRTGRERGYKLDGNSFDLSREGLIKAEFFEGEYSGK